MNLCRTPPSLKFVRGAPGSAGVLVLFLGAHIGNLVFYRGFLGQERSV